MRKTLIRAVRIIVHPEVEWVAIARERESWWRILWSYLAPLALISPLAFSSGVLIGGDGALRRFVDAQATLHFALLSAAAGFVTALLSVAAVALTIRALMPLYLGRRDLTDAFRLVAYAATPVWLAGIVLIAPLERFPLLVIIVLIGVMHGLYLFYLGLHYVVNVAQRDAAECAAVVVVASVVLSTVLGYAGGAAGLFPHM